jgi:hypothetical protein
MLTLVTELRVRTLCHHSSILLGPLGWRREGWVGQGDRTSPWPLLDELGSPTGASGGTGVSAQIPEPDNSVCVVSCW